MRHPERKHWWGGLCHPVDAAAGALAPGEEASADRHRSLGKMDRERLGWRKVERMEQESLGRAQEGDGTGGGFLYQFLYPSRALNPGIRLVESAPAKQ